MLRYAMVITITLTAAMATVLLDDVGAIAVEVVQSVLLISLGFAFLVLETGFVMGLVNRHGAHPLR